MQPALEPLKRKWEAFGWHALEIDGHNYDQVFNAPDEVQKVKGKRRSSSSTRSRGKGIRIVEEEKEGNPKHGVPLSAEEAKVALAELGSD